MSKEEVLAAIRRAHVSCIGAVKHVGGAKYDGRELEAKAMVRRAFNSIREVVHNEFTFTEEVRNYPDYEQRLDKVMYEAFGTNHPAMHDYVRMKFELKLRRCDIQKGIEKAKKIYGKEEK